jgi:hypothetical protein
MILRDVQVWSVLRKHEHDDYPSFAHQQARAVREMDEIKDLSIKWGWEQDSEYQKLS